jgi:hypothetical protein
MQLVVQGAIDPADPDQGEYRGKDAQPPGVEVFCQLSGGGADQDNDRQVIEQLERADHALPRLLPMCSRRLPQQTPKPFPSFGL